MLLVVNYLYNLEQDCLPDIVCEDEMINVNEISRYILSGMTKLPNSHRGRLGGIDRHFMNTAIGVKTIFKPRLPKNLCTMKLRQIFRVPNKTRPFSAGEINIERISSKHKTFV